MVYCNFCNQYVGLFTLSRFCDECADIRRLVLLHTPNKLLSFLKKNLLHEITEFPLEKPPQAEKALALPYKKKDTD